MSKLTVACVQTNSKRDPADNVAEISPMIREASARGADFITTPEIVGMFERGENSYIDTESVHSAFSARSQ